MRPLKNLNYLKNNKELMKEYNYEKNKNSDLNTLTLSSDKKVWWKCNKGHEWEAGIGSRHRTKAGCPICANHKVLKGYNDLEYKCPQIAQEWNYTKNYLKPDEIVYSSNKKVWWKCNKGHEWEATIINRTKIGGTNCPYCTNQKILKGYNDLVTENPKLAQEWDYKKNGKLKPTEIGSKSSKSVWWICSKKHEWKQIIEVRNRGIGCPYCSGRRIIKGQNDLLSKNPRIAKEWDYNKNGNLKPENIAPKSSKKVWWICSKGHEWQTTPSHRSRGQGCPICRKSL